MLVVRVGALCSDGGVGGGIGWDDRVDSGRMT